MVLQALNRYYDILASDPKIGVALAGYSVANVSYSLNLSLHGELLNIFPLFQKEARGKKVVEVSRQMIVPEQVIRSMNISANFLCDGCAYVLGISNKDNDDPTYAIKRHDAFCKLHQEILRDAMSDESKALIAFLTHFDSRHARENTVIASQLETLLKGGNLVFQLEGRQGFIHEAPEIRQIWASFKSGGQNVLKSQCLVTGETAPIAILHPPLKGIKDAQSSGARLVGFNARAYESYNRTKEQGLNSPVGEKAVFAYTTALNYLLSPVKDKKKIIIGDTTVVFWAESNDSTYVDRFTDLFAPELEQTGPEVTEETQGRDNRAEQRLKEISHKVKGAEALDAQNLLENIDLNTRFYILGLAPNASRVSIRFFHQDAFVNTIRRIMAHYADLQIEKEFENQPTYIPLWQLLNETVSRKAHDQKASPLMSGAVMRAILDGTAYPAALYYQVINRIRADMDDDQRKIKKINYTRTAMIKAYLTRKYRNQNQTSIKEVLCMSLNEQSNNQAYLLGRLFAVLEKAQKDAIGDANATITDRYFTSACATPATVFPVLLRLSRHHISKADFGWRSDQLIGEIMGLLDVDQHPFPAHLSLDQQGIFVLGYYHQRTAIYKRHNKTGEEVETNHQIQPEGDQNE